MGANKRLLTTLYDNMTDVDRGRLVRYAMACAQQRPRALSVLRLVVDGDAGGPGCVDCLAVGQQITFKITR
jgi:hypothetical protein